MSLALASSLRERSLVHCSGLRLGRIGPDHFSLPELSKPLSPSLYPNHLTESERLKMKVVYANSFRLNHFSESIDAILLLQSCALSLKSGILPSPIPEHSDFFGSLAQFSILRVGREAGSPVLRNREAMAPEKRNSPLRLL